MMKSSNNVAAYIMMRSSNNNNNNNNIALWLQDVLDRLAENDAEITHLNQSCRAMDDDTILALTAALKHNTVLVKLVLSLNRIGANGCKALASVLSKSSCAIQILELWDNCIRDGGCKALGSMLKTNSKLISLHLAKNGIGPAGAKALAGGLKKNATLLKLWLGRNRIGNKGAVCFGSMLRHNSSLELLNLYGNSIGPEGAVGLATGLQHNSSLQALHMGYNEIGDEGARAFANMLAHNATLQVLHIWGNSIGNQGLASLAAEGLSHNNCLQELGLGGVVLGSTGCKSLGRALQKNKRLRVLLLSGNFLDGDEDNDMMQYIAQGIEHNTSLQRLRLVVSRGNEGYYKAMGAMLSVNTCLKSLVLCNMDMDDEGVIYVMKGMEKNQSLTSLTVEGSHIGNGCTQAIRTMLQKNKTLKELALNSTNIRHFHHLLEGLKLNYNLTKLSFDNNRFLTETLWFYPSLNAAGRRFLSDEPVVGLWARVLANVANEPSLLFYFCCAKPDLFNRMTT